MIYTQDKPCMKKIERWDNIIECDMKSLKFNKSAILNMNIKIFTFLQ